MSEIKVMASAAFKEAYLDCSGNASIVGRFRSFPALYNAGNGSVGGSFIDARPVLIQ